MREIDRAGMPPQDMVNDPEGKKWLEDMLYLRSKGVDFGSIPDATPNTGSTPSLPQGKTGAIPPEELKNLDPALLERMKRNKQNKLR